MGAESGEDAVEFADALKDMKQAEGDRTAADDASGIRYVAGRAFRFSAGAWVDLKYKPGKMKLLKVRYLGKAHFWLIQNSALLKKYFALGERLIVVVGSNRAIEIGPGGQDEVASSELKKFLP